MPTTVRLRPMTATEYGRFMDRSVREYAEDKVRTGQVVLETAVAQATAEFAELLPAGLDSAGQLLRIAVDPADAAVGLIWLGLPTATRRAAWVYDVWVDPAARGRGFGRAIMRAAERELAARGVPELGLNVFGHNPVAIHLYESLGYRVHTQQMSKSLLDGTAD